MILYTYSEVLDQAQVASLCPEIQMDLESIARMKLIIRLPLQYFTNALFIIV